ncbi:uncharacterized protein TRIADDRAFT_24440, partial [Trichoplax adhaerens]
WGHIAKFAFNEKSNRDDDKLGLQIVKDLHRTGYSKFCDKNRPENRAALKRVLLGYARWNKAVGYCQGFNVIAALILDVFEGNEEQALKVMIYLIDYVLPKNYFANNLRALSVDMAVFRDLLREEEPDLCQHLDKLQAEAAEEAGSDYEPPLTNVFTMQWFLTIFATCLPRDTILRIWDCVLLEGSTVLVRTSLALWSILGERISAAENAHEFYSMMGYISQKMLEGRIIDRDALIQKIYSNGSFPHPIIEELRDKYTYNITPFTSSTSEVPSKYSTSGSTGSTRDSDDDDENYVECPQTPPAKCLGGFFPYPEEGNFYCASITDYLEYLK